jgi:hypothetical protein
VVLVEVEVEVSEQGVKLPVVVGMAQKIQVVEVVEEISLMVAWVEQES